MNLYSYKARTTTNETVSGKIEARDQKEASSLLRERGLFVISITEHQESFFSGSLRFDRVSKNDITTFTRQLSTMITAGLTITDALSILEVQAKPALKRIIDTIRRDVEGGLSLAKALEKHKSLFGGVYIALVHAGESAGVLDKMMDRLADTMERQRDFNSKTKGALVYPAIVVLAMIIVAFIMMVFVVPKLTEMYRDFGAQLPAPTRVLIAVSQFMALFWYVVIAGAIAGVFAFRAYRKTPHGQYKIDEFLLRMPVFGPIRGKIALVELTRTLSLLISAGISLVNSLDISLEAVGNMVYREALVKITQDVEKGQPLSQALGKRVEFPIIMSQMISVGEETGKMDEVLMRLSRYFESESEQAVKGLTTALEPLIMIVLGLGVGFLIIAVVLPIYNLTSQF